MTLQLVGQIVTMLNKIATLPRGYADAISTRKLILRAPGQGQVYQGWDEQVTVWILDEPEMTADWVA